MSVCLHFVMLQLSKSLIYEVHLLYAGEVKIVYQVIGLRSRSQGQYKHVCVSQAFVIWSMWMVNLAVAELIMMISYGMIVAELEWRTWDGGPIGAEHKSVPVYRLRGWSAFEWKAILFCLARICDCVVMCLVHLKRYSTNNSYSKCKEILFCFG